MVRVPSLSAVRERRPIPTRVRGSRSGNGIGSPYAMAVTGLGRGAAAPRYGVRSIAGFTHLGRVLW
jgi:hypothetical protein